MDKAVVFAGFGMYLWSNVSSIGHLCGGACEKKKLYQPCEVNQTADTADTVISFISYLITGKKNFTQELTYGIS